MLEANRNTFSAIKISEIHTLKNYPRLEVLAWLETKPDFMRRAFRNIVYS